MIPVRLVLRDFLSYESPEPLDFTAFDIACLSGDNGVGKTALLDAITWACFGSARGCEGGLNQDRLIRDGAEEAVVEYTFSLADAMYKIVRRRSRNGKSELRFVVADGEDWRNIAAETLKQTEAKIGSVLRMDYRTFTASAFFVQGRSDDFLARMRPDERKDVFSRLLDLGTYERLEDAARSKAREADARRKELAARAEELSVGAADVDDVGSQLASAEDRLAHAEAEAKNADIAVRAARERLGELETVDALLASARDRVSAALDAAAQARDEAETKRGVLLTLNDLLARRDEVTGALRELDALRAAEADVLRDKDRAAEIDRRCAEAAATIEAEGRKLCERVADSQRRLHALEQERAALAKLQIELTNIEAALSNSAAVSDSLASVRAERAQHEVAAARSDEQIRAVDEVIAKAKRTLEVLAGGGGECPVCGHPLDRDHRARAKQRIQEEIRTANADRRTARAVRETAKKEAARCAEDIRRMEVSQREHEKLVASREGLIGKLQRMSFLDHEISGLRDACAADEGNLRDHTYCADLRAEVARLEAEREKTYDAAAHRRIQERCLVLRPYEALSGRIEEATGRLATLIEEIEAAERRAGMLDVETSAAHDKIAEMSRQVAALPAARQAVVDQERVLERARASVADLTGSTARLQERLLAARRLAEEIEALRGGERSAATEHRRYRRLAEAFGRGGIPDRIIDNALPELEDDANRILGALSDHEMSVRFVLQRETKSGKAKETFEALVHHEGAIRDFSMFSGGEAFRVAFAVRLAMSKLLVRRAGARLETLVIDEGFGTQDPVGRERLIEAINLARREFAKILVITHLDELKDQFGTQLRVEKGANGSALSLISA